MEILDRDADRGCLPREARQLLTEILARVDPSAESLITIQREDYEISAFVRPPNRNKSCGMTRLRALRPADASGTYWVHEFEFERSRIFNYRRDLESGSSPAEAQPLFEIPIASFEDEDGQINRRDKSLNREATVAAVECLELAYATLVEKGVPARGGVHR